MEVWQLILLILISVIVLVEIGLVVWNKTPISDLEKSVESMSMSHVQQSLDIQNMIVPQSVQTTVLEDGKITSSEWTDKLRHHFQNGMRLSYLLRGIEGTKVLGMDPEKILDSLTINKDSEWLLDQFKYDIDVIPEFESDPYSIMEYLLGGVKHEQYKEVLEYFKKSDIVEFMFNPVYEESWIPGDKNLFNIINAAKCSLPRHQSVTIFAVVSALMSKGYITTQKGKDNAIIGFVESFNCIEEISSIVCNHGIRNVELHGVGMK
jgi:hypothetical protein